MARQHPFALLYLAAPCAFFTAFFLAHLFKERPAFLAVFLCLAACYSFYLFAQERRLDVAEARRTQGLLTLVDHEFPSGYLFPKDSFYAGCGEFNTGMMVYAFSYPNIWIPLTDKTPYAKQVDFDCLDTINGVLRLHAAEKKKNFIVRAGDPNYQTIDDHPR